MIPFLKVQGVLRKNRNELLKKGIEAVGIGYKTAYGKELCELSIVCSVKQKLPMRDVLKAERIPAKISGILTDVVQTGTIQALHTGFHRPAPGGVSVGHTDITAGTLGCIVRKNGNPYILSNNHVLACSNDADLGDNILQPGVYDGGEYPKDRIAKLDSFVHINFGGVPSECPVGKLFTRVINRMLSFFGRNLRLRAISQTGANLVDAALAQPINETDVTDTILEVGKIAGVKPAILGMKIQKSGRTTGLTYGEITQVDVSVNVQHGEGRVAQFNDQIMAGKMCAGGDSGSVVLDMDNNIVGLLHAGSDTVMVACRIEHVFDLLHVHL